MWKWKRWFWFPYFRKPVSKFLKMETVVLIPILLNWRTSSNSLKCFQKIEPVPQCKGIGIRITDSIFTWVPFPKYWNRYAKIRESESESLRYKRVQWGLIGAWLGFSWAICKRKGEELEEDERKWWSTLASQGALLCTNNTGNSTIFITVDASGWVNSSDHPVY